MRKEKITTERWIKLPDLKRNFAIKVGRDSATDSAVDSVRTQRRKETTRSRQRRRLRSVSEAGDGGRGVRSMSAVVVERRERKQKISNVCHAEVNAILNTNHASAAGQSEVSEVVYFVEKSLENSDIIFVSSHKLLTMAGIKVRRHQPKMNQIVLLSRDLETIGVGLFLVDQIY